MGVESKQYSWAWVTADRLLSHGPCELLYVYVAADGQTAGKAIIYNGENILGAEIAQIEAPVTSGKSFRPAEPAYCREGLFVDYGTGAGVFVQWRELRDKEEGG